VLLRSRRLSTAIRANAPIDRPSGGGSRASVFSPQDSIAATPQPAANGGSSPAAPLQTVTIAGEVMVNSVNAPAAIYFKAAEMGAYKASLPWWKIILLGMLAGAYVALGAALLLTVAPNCPGLAQSNPGLQRYIMGAIGFPYALLIILSCGAELFTGNTALVTAAVLEGKADLKGLAKNWVCSYAGNVIGCGLGLLLLANTGLLPQFKAGAEMLAMGKVAYPFKETFLKAIAANWFVCLAVWQAIAAQSFGGKFIACLGPVSAFVCVGLEHCIANMVFVPLGILIGAPVTMWQFITKNLLIVTAGNIVAGTCLVAGMYSLIYGKLGKKITGEA
jgi:formate transporter